jgi:hypothetical protein
LGLRGNVATVIATFTASASGATHTASARSTISGSSLGEVQMVTVVFNAVLVEVSLQAVQISFGLLEFCQQITIAGNLQQFGFVSYVNGNEGGGRVMNDRGGRILLHDGRIDSRQVLRIIADSKRIACYERKENG